MTTNKSIDSAAAAKLPAVTATPQFMSGPQSTKAATYLVAAALAFVAIGLHVHWAIGATIAAAEAALVFDIVTIAARPKPAPGEGIR